MSEKAICMIQYSTYSEAAESKAKECGLDYSGHNRIVSAIADAEKYTLALKITDILRSAITDQGSVKIHELIFNKATSEEDIADINGLFADILGETMNVNLVKKQVNQISAPA